MPPANVVQTRPQDWVYLSEGGSTIVFSYAGPFHPAFTGKILRLRKVALKELHRDAIIEEEDDVAIAFQKTVIATLVPSEFLPDLHVVLVDPTWLSALETLREHDRPPHRRATDQIDKTRQKGILATDLIGGADVLAIEIKPKWGFMPNATHLSEDTAEIKTFTCRFCMHTHYKSKDGLPTQYCPLDLYSTDETRVKKAIRDLWDAWVRSDGSLNNMKVFVSGKMIRPSESLSAIAEFLSATIEVHEALAAVLLPSLRTPVLRTLSNLQRSLDALDIEGIVKLHAMAHSGSAWKNPPLKELQDFAASYHTAYCALDHSQLRPEHVDTYLIAYLLSATFKDCSVILRMRRCTSSEIFIIDLDYKGAERFEKWAELDRRIVEHYRQTIHRKFCVE